MDTRLISLSVLPSGSVCRVESIPKNGRLYRRLWDLGLIEGTVISCLLRGYGGSPIAYKVRGSVITLRKCDAGQILVRPV